MKNFNFIINQFIRCVSGVNLNLSRYAAMVIVLLTLGIGNAWASSSKTYYSTMNVAVTSGQTGYGTVYVTSSGKTSDTKKSGRIGQKLG